MKNFNFIVALIHIMLLSGCATTLVGGMMENEIEVTLDNNSLPVHARSSLDNARTLGVISSDRSSIKAADLFEQNGGYLVKIDRQTAKVGEMTGSERSEALANLCKTQRIDVALLGRVVATETGSMAATMFTGRAKLSQKWVMDMLTCNTSISQSFGGALNMNLGIYNNKAPAELEEKIGAEIAKKILAAIGGDGSKRNAVSRPNAIGTPTAATATAPLISTPVATTTVQADVRTLQADKKPLVALTVREIQVLLNAAGYPVGTADGVSGKRTTEALRKFQSDHQLPSTGIADEPTIRLLGQKN